MSRARFRGVRGNKFGARAVRSGAEFFPSKLEAAVYEQLRLRERAGEIRDIRRQHCVELAFGVRWKVDFSFELCATGERVFAEAKGVSDPGFRVKLTMWRGGAGPGRLEIWRGTYRRPVLAEVVEPKKLDKNEQE